jgi:hypothetical protein
MVLAASALAKVIFAVYNENMNPFGLFLVSVLTPLAMAVVSLVPIYSGLFFACRIIYSLSQHVDISAQAFNIYYIVQLYFILFQYWLEHMVQLSVFSYTLPLLLAPLFGLIISLVGAVIFVRFMRTRFIEMFAS